MAFTQKLPVWLAPGVEPPEVLKNEGWKAGIKPPDAYFNYLQNTAYLALKELQEKAVEASALAGKVDKEPGKGLSSADFTVVEKTKLAGIQTGATNYQHPTTHPATMITEDPTHRFVTDVEKTNWNGKETTTGSQQKVDALAGAGNTKTVKQLDDALATHSADYAKHPAIVTATNTGNAYSVVLDPAPVSYTNGMGLVVTIPADSTGDATVDVNGLGVKDIRRANGDVVDDLKANGVYTLRFNAVTGAFTLQGEGGLSSADLTKMINDINTLIKM